MSQLFYLRRTGNRAVHMVGYGATHPRSRNVSIELLRPTLGQATGGIWHYLPDGQRVFKPVAALNNRYPRWIAVDPTNPDRWMLLVNSINSEENFVAVGNELRANDGLISPVHISEDNGVTWSPCVLTDPGAAVFRIARAEFDPAGGGRWWISARRQGGGDTNGGVWRGLGTNGGDRLPFGGAGDQLPDPRNLIPGVAGDLVLLPSNESNWHGLMRGTAVQFTRLGNPRSNLVGDRQFGGQTIVAVSQFTDGGQLWVTPNYRGPSLQAVGVDPWTGIQKTGFGEWVCMLADGTAYLGGRGGGAQLGDGGVLRVTNPTTGATPSLVAGTEGIETSFIRSDRQTGTKWACCLPHSTDVLVQSDGVVTRVTGPDGIPFGDLADRVEVIVRGGSGLLM